MARTTKNTEELENAEVPSESGTRDETETPEALVEAATPAEAGMGEDNGTREKPGPEAVGGPAGALESIAVLADRFRLASWQLAALLRLMDWEADRMVTEDEFAGGLALLQNRRIGGGRM